MKKAMLIIAGFAFLLVSLSAIIDTRRSAAIGSVAPSLKLENTDTVVALDGLRGKMVVLSFWSAADAHSRLTQNKIAVLNKSLAELYPTERSVEVLSVNLDRSEQLMREIVRLDNLDNSSQFYVGKDEVAKHLCDAYEMKNGLRTFIIDEEGRIVKADPTEDDLVQVFNNASGGKWRKS